MISRRVEGFVYFPLLTLLRSDLGELVSGVTRDPFLASTAWHGRSFSPFGNANAAGDVKDSAAPLSNIATVASSEIMGGDGGASKSSKSPTDHFEHGFAMPVGPLNRGKARVSRDFPANDFVWEAKGNEYDVETGPWAPPTLKSHGGRRAGTDTYDIYRSPNIGCLLTQPPQINPQLSFDSDGS